MRSGSGVDVGGCAAENRFTSSIRGGAGRPPIKTTTEAPARRRTRTTTG